MSLTMYVVPKSGLQVPDPDRGDHLPAAGRTVAQSPYWFRRVAEGEVTRTDAPPASVVPAYTLIANGPSASRPANPDPSWIRFNTELGHHEVPSADGEDGWAPFGGSGGISVDSTARASAAEAQEAAAAAAASAADLVTQLAGALARIAALEAGNTTPARRNVLLRNGNTLADRNGNPVLVRA